MKTWLAHPAHSRSCQTEQYRHSTKGSTYSPSPSAMPYTRAAQDSVWPATPTKNHNTVPRAQLTPGMLASSGCQPRRKGRIRRSLACALDLQPAKPPQASLHAAPTSWISRANNKILRGMSRTGRGCALIPSVRRGAACHESPLCVRTRAAGGGRLAKTSCTEIP
jgi:hypothetical protein